MWPYDSEYVVICEIFKQNLNIQSGEYGEPIYFISICNLVIVLLYREEVICYRFSRDTQCKPQLVY
jgi:hypothetical protein